MTLNPNVGAARMVGGQISAMNTAAGNPGGAMNGFIGYGMAMNAGGMNAANLYAVGQNQPVQQTAQPAQPAPAAPADGWTCPNCGNVVKGNFCPECGEKKPAPAAEWVCPNCGAKNKGKFCSECGEKKPEAPAEWTCPKCGKVNTG